MTPVSIRVDETQSVSGLLQTVEKPIAGVVLAHGAGAGMTHSFMQRVADGLVGRRVAVLRYQFPYMEAGSKRPDRPALAHATVRAAVAAAAQRLPGVPLFAGGKSFGGRMTSQAEADAPMADLRGLVFFGFPLHAAKKPSKERADHLTKVSIPMLFLQGTRDALADIGLITPTVAALGDGARLAVVDEADHSFHVPARSGRTDSEVMEAMLDTVAGWMKAVLDLSPSAA